MSFLKFDKTNANEAKQFIGKRVWFYSDKELWNDFEKHEMMNPERHERGSVLDGVTSLGSPFQNILDTGLTDPLAMVSAWPYIVVDPSGARPK